MKNEAEADDPFITFEKTRAWRQQSPLNTELSHKYKNTVIIVSHIAQTQCYSKAKQMTASDN